MKSIEWIEKLITAKNLPSDRQAAILLGMTSAGMSGHRSGRLTTLDDKYAYKLEELLNLPHGKIVADQHAERASDPNISAMWRKLATSAAAITLGIIISGKSEQTVACEAVPVNQWVAGSSPAGGAIQNEGLQKCSPFFIAQRLRLSYPTFKSIRVSRYKHDDNSNIYIAHYGAGTE